MQHITTNFLRIWQVLLATIGLQWRDFDILVATSSLFFPALPPQRLPASMLPTLLSAAPPT